MRRRYIMALMFAFAVILKGVAVAALIDNGNGTVTDGRTNLTWQQDEAGVMAWGPALAYCESLTLGGTSDWRLPNVKELESLTDDSRRNPAIDTTFFPNVHTSSYWSSTTYTQSSRYAWWVSFYNGVVSYLSKYNEYYVRCVRGGSSPVSTLSITPAPATPQPVSTRITFTASASGGSGSYLYQFFLRNTSGTWSIVRTYSPTPTWSWDTSGLPVGNYMVQVWAKNNGSSASYEVYKSLSYTLTTPPPASSVTITPDKVSPQYAGTIINFTAAASGGSGAYQYQFWLRNAAGVFSVSQPYSSASSWSWNTAGLPAGNYMVQVWAKNTGSSASYEAYRSVDYSLTLPPPASSVTITPDKSSPQTVGAQVTFTAAASGGSGTYQYQFYVLNPTTGTWTLSRAYSSTPTWTWATTGLTAGVYSIQVQARNNGSAASYEVYNTISYTINPTVTVTMNPTSPQPSGTGVTFNAAVVGGSGTYQYQFIWRNPATGLWTVGQAYSTASSWTWNTTGLPAGTCTIQVWAKKTGSTAAYDYFKSLSYVLQ